MKHVGDITKLSGRTLPPVDVITGGSPCQDLSQAAHIRRGLAGERSGLFYEQVRIVKEMRDADGRDGKSWEYIRPRYMVWENVKHALASNGGSDFQTVLTEIVRIVEPDAPDVPVPGGGKFPHAGCIYDPLGRWSVAWRLHNSQFWGVAQRRERIALVADFAGLSAPEVLFERKMLRWDSETCGEVGEDPAAEAEAGAGDAGGEPILIEMTSTKNTIVTDGVSPTLTCRMGTGGNQVNAVLTYAMQRIGEYKESDQASTLKARDHKDATDLVVTYQDTVGCLMASGYAKQGTQEAMNDMYIVGETGTVRRLTPLEAERLQGMPDGWTDIGEWIDSNGRRRKSSDTLRYKAIGNAIATPFWYRLLLRISAQYDRPATLGSLFDGVGCFPLCWARINGVENCVWASEIDDFPMAVSKRHFGDDDTGTRGDYYEAIQRKED